MEFNLQSSRVDEEQLKIIQDEISRGCFKSQQQLFDVLWDRVLTPHRLNHEGFEKELSADVEFLDKTRTWTMNRLEDFYNRLPDISDPALVVTEFQTHTDELITHIQNLEKTIKEIFGEAIE